MTKTMDDQALPPLAQGLSAVAARLGPEEAKGAAATLSQAMTQTTDPDALSHLARGLTTVATRLDPKEAAIILTQAMTKATDQEALSPQLVLPPLAQGLSAVLLREDASRSVQRGEGVAGAVGVLSGPGSVLIAPALLQPALEPLPPPLPAQTLVDLLKQPFCVGEARRLVLEQLARHYQRPFADQWDFVRFAQEQGLELDFTTPPKRPALDTDMAK